MEIVLQGNLKFFRLPDLLGYFHRGSRSGTLNVVDETNETYIFFENGDVIFANSNQEHLRLGSVLMRKGKIDHSQKARIEKLMLEQGALFGRMAIDENLLTEEDLQHFLKIQVSEIIYDCFSWDQGKFSILDVMQLPSHAVTISIDLPNLIMEGARRVTDVNRLQQFLPPSSSVFRMLGDQASTEEKIHLSLPEWKVLFLIDGKRTLKDICESYDGDSIDVLRLLYGLYANQMMEVVTRRSSDDAFWKSGPDTALLISSTANLTMNDVLKVTLARLTWKKTERETLTFPLIDQEYYIGRQLGNHIHIPDPSVSNVHARIFKGPEGFVLEDLSSRNGTFINGSRIDRKVLKDQDSVRLGKSNFEYSIVFEVKAAPDSTGKETF